MARAIKSIADDGITQIVHYHPGVGTGNGLDRLIGGGTGVGLSRNVRDAYAFLVNNYQPGSPFRKIQTIPSLKIDHNITHKSKISGYWSQESTTKDVGQDGLPDHLFHGLGRQELRHPVEREAVLRPE